MVGPLALGRMSKSKISVGIAMVQQAFGMSTMPLMRPAQAPEGWPAAGAKPAGSAR